MTVRSVLCCAVLLALGTSTWGADKTKPKTSAKAAPKASVKPASKTLPKTHETALKATPPLKGKTEVLTCRDGTEDRHARIAVVLVGGKTDSFAYYSKWKPRTCSIYLQRNRDPHSKWTDAGSVTNVNLERGLFLIEHKKGEYRFVFRDIDRERYCGMDGTINGSLILRRGTERCELAGIMEEGVPLGQAHAHMEQAAPAAVPGAATGPPAVAALPSPRQWFQRGRRDPRPVWPSAAVGISD